MQDSIGVHGTDEDVLSDDRLSLRFLYLLLF
jgi:hypothetical protein